MHRGLRALGGAEGAEVAGVARAQVVLRPNLPWRAFPVRTNLSHGFGAGALSVHPSGALPRRAASTLRAGLCSQAAGTGNRFGVGPRAVGLPGGVVGRLAVGGHLRRALGGCGRHLGACS